MIKDYYDLPVPVYLLCLGTFVNRVGTLVIIFLSRYIEAKLGLGAEFATQTIGMFGLGSLLAALAGGHLADRVGRRFVMIMALLGSALVLAVFPYLGSPLSVLAAAFVLALVGDMYRPAASAMIADLVTPDRRAHAFGLMYFSINLGVSFAPFVGGYLAAVSFPWLFRVDALTAGAYGLFIAITIKETLPSNRSNANVTPQASAHPDQTEPPSPSLRAAAQRIVGDRVFMIYALAVFLTSIVYLQCISTLPIHFMDCGISTTTFGSLIAINGIMIVALQLPITSVVNRLPRGSMMMLGSLLIGVGYWIVGFHSAVWFFGLSIAVWTLGELVHAPLMHAIVSDLAPVDLRGRYMGVIAMSFAAALTVGAPIGGMVLQRAGEAFLWWGCLGLSVLAALCFYRVRGAIEKRDMAAPGA